MVCDNCGCKCDQLWKIHIVGEDEPEMVCDRCANDDFH